MNRRQTSQCRALRSVGFLLLGLLSLGLALGCSRASEDLDLEHVESGCAFQETYQNRSVRVLSTSCSVSHEETLHALGSMLVGSAVTGVADNVVSKILGTSSKRIFGWISVFGDLQAGSEWVQNPLRAVPVANGLKRSSPRLVTILFPTFRIWEAPRKKQTDEVGVLLAIDFLASPFSQNYWHEEWPIWLQVRYKNQAATSQQLMSSTEVGRYIKTDQCHVLLLTSEHALPVEKIVAGCPGRTDCGVTISLVSGESVDSGAYRAETVLILTE